MYKFVSEEIFFKLSNTDRKNMHAAYFGDHRPTDHAPLKTYGIARLVIIGNILLLGWAVTLI